MLMRERWRELYMGLIVKIVREIVTTLFGGPPHSLPHQASPSPRRTPVGPGSVPSIRYHLPPGIAFMNPDNIGRTAMRIIIDDGVQPQMVA